MSREKINLSDSSLDLMVKMSEGNPGAMRVLMELLKQGQMINILDLDDMGMRGAQIWVAYKDHCNCDIEKLISALRERSPDLVATVNRKCPDHLAVEHGASFNL